MSEIRADLASCECVHALRDHASSGRRHCLVCDDCPMFVWSGSFYRTIDERRRAMGSGEPTGGDSVIERRQRQQGGTP